MILLNITLKILYKTRSLVLKVKLYYQQYNYPKNAFQFAVLLAAEDVNVIVVDWSAGAGSLSYREVNFNCVTSAAAVADFIKWLNQASGSTVSQYHIIGHGVGGHQAGIVGRNLDSNVPYITGKDNIFK